MRKKPRGRQEKKVKKTRVASPPVELQKEPEKIHAQQDTTSAPLPYPHPSSAPALWLDFAKTARRLHFLCNTRHIPLDYDLLEGVIRDCHRMLFKAIRHGDARAHPSQAAAIRDCLDMLRDTIKLGRDDAKGTVITLFNATKYGCDRLAESDQDEKSRKAVIELASETGEWPVMLSPKKKSLLKAQNYLKKLGVGIKSFPPTANTKISGDVRWTELAAMVIKKIEYSQPLLRAQAVNYKSPSADERNRFDILLLEANKYPEILKLPEKLNVGTRKAWWKVAKKMLKAYWEDNSAEARDDFKKVEGSAKKSLQKSGDITGKILDEKSQGKLRAKSRICAIHSVREAFYVLAATQ
jgi:hypothetical protein